MAIDYQKKQTSTTGPNTHTEQQFSKTTEKCSGPCDGQNVKTEYQQQNMRQVETEVTHKKCPVTQNPVEYTEEARRMDIKKEQLDRNIDQMDKRMDQADAMAKDKNAQIDKLETEAEKAAKSLNKEHEKFSKKLTKEQEKLQKQEEKTMAMAQELAQKQQEQALIERKKAEEAMAKDAEAHRLATELANKRANDRKFAEQKMHELQTAEEEIKRKARELAEHQAKEIHEFEIKQKEMNVNVEVARKNMEELKRRHDQELRLLEENKAKLEQLRAEAKIANDTANKHNQEIAELEQRIRELDQKALQEREKANMLNKDRALLENVIPAQKQAILQDQSALKDTEQMLLKQQEEKKTITVHAKEQLKNEELAHQKALSLASKTTQERRELQKDLANLVGEEEEAKKRVSELEKTAKFTVEEKPATVDVYTHQRYETKEPVVTEINVEERSKTTEESSKSLPGKIIDGVKNLF